MWRARFQRRLVPGLSALAVGLALGFALRYLVIEPRQIGQLCGGVGIPWWCAPRAGLIKAHEWFAYGVGAGLCAAIAWWRDDRRWAAAALACAGLGLVLYNSELAATGLLLALIKLSRA